MGIIVVNGTRIEVEDRPGGNQIRVSGDTITVNGNTVSTGLFGVTRVEWTGPVANVTAQNASISVSGDVSGSVDAGGSVTCESVGGDVDAGGSVSCNGVGGDVDAGGSVQCGQVHGSVSAGGSIHGVGSSKKR